MSKKIIGIDLGGTSIKFAILTLDGEVQEKWSIKTNILDEGSHIVDDMIESIAHRLKMLELDASEFQGIGMGSPGVVDREKGTVIGAYNLNWKTLQPVKEKIESALHIPFFIDNDANVAALGERWKGAGENQPDVVFMTLGTGIVNLTCRYADEYEGDSQLKVLIDNGEEVTAKTVFDLAKEGDALALIVYKNFSRYLGLAAANIGSTLNPSKIVIGGGVSAAGDFLLDGVRKVFEENSFPQVRESTQLALATLGNDAGVIGAASLVLQ